MYQNKIKNIHKTKEIKKEENSFHKIKRNPLIDENFFVIDSNELKNIQSHMYVFLYF